MVKKKQNFVDEFIPPDYQNRFVPLGGSGEIGMNLNLYGHDSKWLIVDFGITFGNETTPGVDVIFPDISFIRERRNDLVGMVITHAHEDHLGAIPYIWKNLECDIYCTPFTAAIIRGKCEDSGVKIGNHLKVVPLGSHFELGPFYIEFISMTHSIPEPSAIYIKTKAGNILHTGDWKIDENPVIGQKPDLDRLKQIGSEGLDVLVCDSTNALVDHGDENEYDVQDALIRILHAHPHRIILTCFASNIARIKSVYVAAKKSGRDVALVGRSLWRMYMAAVETGHLERGIHFLSDNDLKSVDESRLVLIATGSQGEHRAALARIANDSHPTVKLKSDDLVLFSSREIPENELSLNRVKNNLSDRGVKFVTADDDIIHVSGHPARDQLHQIYGMLHPKISVPVHGEPMHQHAHKQLAYDCGVPQVMIAENGHLFAFEGGVGSYLAEIEHGRYALQGDKIVKFDHEIIREKFRMINLGMVFVSFAMTAQYELADDPVLSTYGIFDDHGIEMDKIDDMIVESLQEAAHKKAKSEDHISNLIRPKIRKYMLSRFGVKPHVEIHILQV